METEKKHVLPMDIQFFAEQTENVENETEVETETETTEAETETETTEVEETAEEKLAKLMAENKRLKVAMDKATSEAAESKKKLKAKMTQAEKLETEKLEREAAKETELQELRRKVDINEKTATLMDLGYSKAQAKKAAEAQIDGDFETYTQIQKDVIEAKVKLATAKALKDMPIPPAGGKHSSVTKEQFEQMSYSERVKLFSDDPETYKKLNS